MSRPQVFRLLSPQVAGQTVQAVGLGVAVLAARVLPQRLGNRRGGMPPVEQYRHGYVLRLASAGVLRLL